MKRKMPNRSISGIPGGGILPGMENEKEEIYDTVMNQIYPRGSSQCLKGVSYRFAMNETPVMSTRTALSEIPDLTTTAAKSQLKIMARSNSVNAVMQTMDYDFDHEENKALVRRRNYYDEWDVIDSNISFLQAPFNNHRSYYFILK